MTGILLDIVEIIYIYSPHSHQAYCVVQILIFVCICLMDAETGVIKSLTISLKSIRQKLTNKENLTPAHKAVLLGA